MSHIITGLTNGTSYTFTVTATNAVGTSAASTASNSVTPATVPGAPTNVHAAGGNTQATVTFMAPTSDGGSPITGYTATSNPGGITGTCVASPCIVSGLTNGTAYTFTVTATNAVGTSLQSAPSNSVIAEPMPNVYFIYSDHLATPRQITDTSGNVVWQWDNSDPFGNNMPNENPSNLGTFNFNLRFPGQYFDKETGLHQNFHRDYDPAIGAYKQFDPIGLAGGINGYAYANGNPIRYRDPYGQSGWDSAVGAIIGYIGGSAGSAVYQYISTGDVNWASANEAGAWGAAAGAIAPIVATTATGAAAVGALSNAAQYVSSTDNFSTSDFIQTTIAGGIGGFIGGPFINSGNIFTPTTAAQSINANFTARGIGSAIAGGGIASVNTVPNNGTNTIGSGAGTTGDGEYACRK